MHLSTGVPGAGVFNLPPPETRSNGIKGVKPISSCTRVEDKDVWGVKPPLSVGPITGTYMIDGRPPSSDGSD